VESGPIVPASSGGKVLMTEHDLAMHIADTVKQSSILGSLTGLKSICEEL
jgi:hypothetical protein